VLSLSQPDVSATSYTGNVHHHHTAVLHRQHPRVTSVALSRAQIVGNSSPRGTNRVASLGEPVGTNQVAPLGENRQTMQTRQNLTVTLSHTPPRSTSAHSAANATGLLLLLPLLLLVVPLVWCTRISSSFGYHNVFMPQGAPLRSKTTQPLV